MDMPVHMPAHDSSTSRTRCPQAADQHTVPKHSEEAEPTILSYHEPTTSIMADEQAPGVLKSLGQGMLGTQIEIR